MTNLANAVTAAEKRALAAENRAQQVETAAAQQLQVQTGELRETLTQLRSLTTAEDRRLRQSVNKLSLNSLPIGTIMPFAAPLTSFPHGYLLYNGALFPREKFPLLFSTIGIS